MNGRISDICGLLQEIAWHFGDRGINGECCGDLSCTEFTALKKISEKSELSVQEIGGALSFTKSGATRIIDRLEDKGYAVRKHSPADGRVCCVSITARGEEALRDAARKYAMYLEDVLKETEPERIDRIQESLEILLQAVRRKETV